MDFFRRPLTPPRTFFLSHYHGDHYSGITDRWDRGVIHCSPITARLLLEIMAVAPRFVKAMALDVAHDMGDGHKVTLIDAHHCPGEHGGRDG